MLIGTENKYRVEITPLKHSDTLSLNSIVTERKIK
jgi:hypothetical protein